MNAFMGGMPQFTRHTRSIIEDEIERLICLLDLIDGDCDLEEDDPAEGDLAWYGASAGGRWEHDLEQDLADDEPSLGWPENFDQAQSCGIESNVDLERDDTSGPTAAFDGSGRRIATSLLNRVVTA